MNRPVFGFELLAKDGAARCGRVTTAHGTFETPAFMTVGTAGTVKGLTPEQVAAAARTYRVGYRKFYPPPLDEDGEATDEQDDDQRYLMEHTASIFLVGPDGSYRPEPLG